MRRAPGHRRRAAVSLALSAGLHALVLIGLPALWLTTEEPPEVVLEVAPEIVEVQLVHVDRPAAPVDALRPSPPSAPKPARAVVDRPATAAAATVEPGHLARSRTAEPLASMEPVVECRVRLVSREIMRPRLERPPWLQARAEHGVEPWAEHPDAPGAPGPAAELSARADPAQEKPGDLPFVAHTHGLESLSPAEAALVRAALEGPPLPLEGDRQPLIDSIQARLDGVTPLVHATAWGCRHHQGRAELRFLIGPRGYALGYQLVSSSGSYCLDGYINEVLHLAEPFPRVQGWVPVHVAFERFRAALGDN